MVVTYSSSTPSLVQKKISKMELKSLANRNKGKRHVVEDDDSNFAPLSKRGRALPKKKSKVAAHEKIPQDDAKKNDQDGVGLQYKLFCGFETIKVCQLHCSLRAAKGLVHVVFL
ncbi:hypothetical protein CsatB_030078 [Cannabis sativa]|uniref:uncharacterized protein LOC133030298 n=1 Tax=Cannabis sativa TaxID=3483 RepID=UPI0029CA5857|nr:uncharacterized protein LOC133030298 [Cannabis sativa]XP_060958899.1 uncharacterized protein LOC133030301 [Cannabis sativa]XP_060959676.1 uncharacterized protein LOC133030804 [Cannabis sativa]